MVSGAVLSPVSLGTPTRDFFSPSQKQTRAPINVNGWGAHGAHTAATHLSVLELGELGSHFGVDWLLAHLAVAIVVADIITTLDWVGCKHGVQHRVQHRVSQTPPSPTHPTTAQ